MHETLGEGVKRFTSGRAYRDHLPAAGSGYARVREGRGRKRNENSHLHLVLWAGMRPGNTDKGAGEWQTPWRGKRLSSRLKGRGRETQTCILTSEEKTLRRKKGAPSISGLRGVEVGLPGEKTGSEGGDLLVVRGQNTTRKKTWVGTPWNMEAQERSPKKSH